MVPSIDYLTMVIAGAILLAGATSSDRTRMTVPEFVMAVAGLFLFIVGVVRAFMSAFGL